MFQRVGQMVMKELIQALRDKRMRVFLFVPPLMQLMIFGYIVSLDVKNVQTAFYDMDKSSSSREVLRRLASSGIFDIKYFPESDADVTALIEQGRASVSVKIQNGFAKDIALKRPAPIQVIIDGTDSNSATIALGYMSKILASYAVEMSSPASAPQGLDVRTNFWFNPDLRSRNYNVPGVIAGIIMIVCVMLTSMAVVKEREAGTMEQLLVTPIRPIDLILGKTIPFALVGFIDLSLISTVGVFWFDIPIRGSIAVLVLGTSVYILSVLGVGLFISTVSRTQQQAMLAAMMFNMPAILLSGFVFPIENMPAVFQQATYLNPLRYFLLIIRGVFLKGAGMDVLWPQMAALLALGTGIFALSILRFNKRL